MGVGALIMREGLPFAALAVGGGQEARRRAGSENVAGISGFGAAARIALAELENFTALRHLRDEMEEKIATRAPDAIFLGSGAERLPNTSYIAAPGLDAETLLMALDLDGIAVSAGAACSSGKVGRPRVLDAMGVPADLAKGAVRVSLGWTSKPEDIDAFGKSWLRAYERARAKAGVGTGMNASENAGMLSQQLASVES
jgi:cysteine desulfurase